MFRTFASTLVAAGALAAPAFGQLAPECRNAAVDYWRATNYLRTADMEKVSAVDWALIGNETDAHKLPPTFIEAVAAIESFDEAFVDALRAAVNTEICDFHIEFDKGYMALLPHLSGMRNAARALRVSARRELAEGNPDAAAERVAIIYGMAGHLGNDTLLISSLLASAISMVADAEAAVMMDTSLLTAEGRDTILNAIERLDPEDPFNFKSTALGEVRWGGEWVRRTFTGPDAGKHFLEKTGMAFADTPRDAADRVAAMDGQALRREIDKASRYFDDVLIAWDSPRAPELLAVIDGRARSGEYGDFGVLVAPSYAKAYNAYDRAGSGLRETAKRLREYQPPAPKPAAEPALQPAAAK